MKESEFWLLYSLVLLAPHLESFGIGMATPGIVAFLWYMARGK
jgi:hypothetical protein